MLYGFLLFFYLLTCLLLIGVVLIQKTKSSIGLGGLGGGTQMLFGGSGGQDLFQKMTWGLGILFMALSLWLSLMKSTESKSVYFVKTNSAAATTIPVAKDLQNS